MRTMKIQEVTDVTNLSRTSIYRMVGEGTFPSPIKLSKRSVVWVVDEVHQWLEVKANERTQHSGGCNA